MLRFSFKRGMVFSQGPLRWTLDRILPNHKFQFLSDNGDVKSYTESEVHSKYLNEEWVVDKDTLRATSIYLQIPRDLSTYSANHQRQATRRYEYIKFLNPRERPYNPAIWQDLIEKHAHETNDKRPPCASTVHNWWSRYREGKDINSLTPRNNGRITENNTDRYSIFMEAINTFYMTAECLPKSAIFVEVEKVISRINDGVHENQRIKCPARSTIYQWIDCLRPDVVEEARLGKRAARLKYTSSSANPAKLGLLSRLEMDHTPIDLIIVDDKTYQPIGRPWLSVALESASRMPMGFYVGFHAPSAHSVVQCLLHAILPKSDWLKVYQCEGNWPAHGIPDKIFVDNGMDFHSGALAMTALELGVELIFCPAKEPKFKGKIERFFKTLNMGLFHQLPGTTKSNTRQRGDYDSAGNAVLTLNDLMHIITKYLVDIYMLSPHRGLKHQTPLSRWNALRHKKVIEFPINPKDIEVLGGRTAERAVWHYGIEFKSLFYNGDRLNEHFRTAKSSKNVMFKYYDHTVDYIDVYDPRGKYYFRVNCTDSQYSTGLSRPIHELTIERAIKLYGNDFSKAQRQAARDQINEIIESARKSKRMASRKKAHAVARSSSESLLAQRDPFDQVTQEVMSSEPPAVPLASGLNDQLPQVGNFEEGAV